MAQRVACGALLTLPLTALAGPLVIEPTATIPSPSARFDRVVDAAIDGDWLIMAALYNETLDPGGDYEHGVAAFLFKRDASGTWTYVRQLAEVITNGVYGYHPRPTSVAIDDGLAALNLAARVFVFERSGEDWVEVPIEAGYSVGTSTEIDDGTILLGESSGYWAAHAYRKNAAGVYESVYLYEGAYYYEDENAITGGFDISGSTIVLPQSYSELDPEFQRTISVWEGVPPVIGPINLYPPPGSSWIAGQARIEGGTIVVVDGASDSSPLFRGFNIYRRQSSGAWEFEKSVARPDALMYEGGSVGLQLEDGLLLQTVSSYSTGSQTDVFEPTSEGSYEYVAKLPGVTVGHHQDGRVVGIGENEVKVFELPDLSKPPQKRDDFQDGDAIGWVAQPGSDYQVKTTSYSNVYRQSSLTGNALSILSDTDWTIQSIQADVKPTAFDGNDRWFGLIARYTDANNYYYVTARRSNVIQIRKIVNGAFQVLASAQLPITLNRTYRLRLEAVDDTLRLYVDGKLTAEAKDASHTHGQAGLMTYKTRADYDNVIVSPRTPLTLFPGDFNVYRPGLWDTEGESWYPDNDVLVQASTSGTPRAIAGTSVADQSVQARVRPTAFGAAAQAWFGLMARVVDSSNYYYVTVRRNNTISLRRLTDGVIHVLDSGTLNVAQGTAYRLRLETIGSSIRAYVNGKLLLEATDSTIESGRYGFVTYSAAAEFGDLLVTQP